MPAATHDKYKPNNADGATANVNDPPREIERPKRVVDFVDDLEAQLSTALKDYRHHAEEALGKHLENLEKVDVAVQLELAQLRAENAQLREHLSLAGKTKPELCQTVLFQDSKASDQHNRAQATDEFSSKAPGKKKVQTADNSNSNPNLKRAETKMLKRNKQGDKQAGGQNGEASAAGGSWQQFVAWVPNGAALQQPEPWKPLPQDELANVAGQGQPGGTQGTGKGKQKNVEWTNILPGAVDPEEGGDNVGHEAELMSNSSNSTEENAPVELLEIWHATKRELDKARKSAHDGEYQSRGSGLTDPAESTYSAEEGEDDGAGSASKLMINPNSKMRITWDTLSLLMVVYDMIMIPMMLFNMPDAIFLRTMDWMTRLFWTTDMGWSVSTGVVMPDGKVEMKWGFTIKRYLRSWFCIDIIIVASDWAEYAAGSAGSGLEVASITRILRIARVARLMRLARAQGVIQALTERIQSDFIIFVMSILKVMLFVVFISHIMACCWWGIGEADSAASWILEKDFKDRSVSAQYLVSLQWALVQFTGGMDEITAVNEGERLFTIFVWVFTFMAACIIVSVLTSNLTQLHIIGGAQSRQLSTLRKYLKQNGVSSNLTLRVQRNAQHAISGDLTDEAVELLPIVSEPLRMEMHFEMYCWLLRQHPLFADYMQQAPQILRKLCHSAVTTMMLDSGDVLFSKGEVPSEPRMYFVARGTLKYQCSHGESTIVREKHWVSEGALWTVWRHRGTLTATSDVKVAVLNGLAFQNILGKFKKKGVTNPKLYAKTFVEELNGSERITDLGGSD